MLREINAVKQDPGEGPKRWFSDPEMDLFVWWDPSGGIRKFQLACKATADEKGGGPERALTWTASGGFLRHLVDDGEGKPARYKAAPILVPAESFPIAELVETFMERARHLEPGIRDFVVARLDELRSA